MNTQTTISKQWCWILFGMITVVHLLGMVLIDIMDMDAAQYASMSREMFESGEYLQLKNRGVDYLDKPPLLFWVSSLSFKLFGVSNFTYRLPSFIFLLLGVFSTFRLGQLYYNRRTGILAALVLYSCQAYFLFSHDVRTDTILANVLIFGLWQLVVFMKDRSLLSLVLGSIGIGFAMLEKGPIGLMVAVWALGSEIVYKRDWKVLLRWEWLLGFVVLAVVLAPMTYGLYQQFGWEGVEFFYWTQSFGRITGQSEWQDDSTILYFANVFIWAFLPWVIFGVYGIGKSLVNLFKSKFSGSEPVEVLTLGGFLITFAALSMSNYKLPHYIFVVFPLVAIITAKTIWEVIDSKRWMSFFVGFQWLLFTIAWLLVALLLLVVFPVTHWMVIVIASSLFLISLYFLAIKRSVINQLLYSSFVIIIGVNFVLNTHFYPSLLEYQSGSVAGKYVVENSIPVESIYYYEQPVQSFDFYTRSINKIVDAEFLINNHGVYIFTGEEGKAKLNAQGVSFEVVKEFDAFLVTLLNIKFLNPAKRDQVVYQDYLLKTK